MAHDLFYLRNLIYFAVANPGLYYKSNINNKMHGICEDGNSVCTQHLQWGVCCTLMTVRSLSEGKVNLAFGFLHIIGLDLALESFLQAHGFVILFY